MFKQPHHQGEERRHASVTTICALVQTLEDGNKIVLNKNGSIVVHNAEDGRELERYNVVIGSVISDSRRRQGEEGRNLRAMGSVQRPDSVREERARSNSAT